MPVARARWLSIALACGALAGCSTRTASYDDAKAIAAPTFAPTPARPAESPQLEALALRDTAGLGAPGPNANPALLEPALAAVQAAYPGTDRIGDLYFDDSGVWMTILDPEVAGRTRSLYYRLEDDRLFGGDDPRFDDEQATFPITDVHIDAITALVNGLAERYPTMQIDTPRLDVGLSYDLGLSWRMDLVDARGTLATIFTDLDGTVTVVDRD